MIEGSEPLNPWEQRIIATLAARNSFRLRKRLTKNLEKFRNCQKAKTFLACSTLNPLRNRLRPTLDRLAQIPG